jgi:Uma2 family endonuclease
MSSRVHPDVTSEEYLVRERQAAYRSEYINGRVYALAGASHRHSLIIVNAAAEIRAQLRGRPCFVYVNDMRVKVSPTGAYTYPDVVALCGAPRFEDEQADTLLNPSVLIEVLSDSTERYDRGEKFAQSRRIESLREYVLVAQDRVRVERFVREGDVWLMNELNDLDSVLVLPSIDASVQLRDLYEQVEFSESERLADNP